MSLPPLPLLAYAFASESLRWVAPWVFAQRAKAGKEDPTRVPERLAAPETLDRTLEPQRPVIWLHAASVGESVALRPLLTALRDQVPDARFLVTTQTIAGAQVWAADHAKGLLVHRMAPLDAPSVARRFVKGWQPKLAIFAESEIWPSLTEALQADRVPMAIVNARMTETSAQGWARVPRVARLVLDRFASLTAADAATAERLSALSGRPVANVGNLKFDAPPLSADPERLAPLLAAVGDRPCWIAASTHEGEEAMMLAAHRVVCTEFPDALLILIPRHPARAEAIAALTSDAGFAMCQRSFGQLPEPNTSIYLADTMGEMGTLLRAGQVCVLGGSFVPAIGGHNPVEPNRLGLVTLSGPDVFNFSDVFERLSQAGCVTITSVSQLPADIIAALRATPDPATLIDATEKVLGAPGAAVAATMAALKPYLPKRS